MPLITHEQLDMDIHVKPVLVTNGVVVLPAAARKGQGRFKRNNSQMLIYIRNNELVIRANGDTEATALANTLLTELQPFGAEITIHLYL